MIFVAPGFFKMIKLVVRICTLVGMALLPMAATFAQDNSLANQLPIEGYSQPGRVAKLAAATTGIFEGFLFQEGEQVRLGDCIANLDAMIHVKLVEIARVSKASGGEIKSAEAELQASRTRLSRIVGLANRQHASQVELLQAKENVSIAEANLLITREKKAAARCRIQ